MAKYNTTVIISVTDAASKYSGFLPVKHEFILTEKPTWRSQFECFNDLKRFAPEIHPHTTYKVMSEQNSETDRDVLDEDTWLLLLNELQATDSGVLSFYLYECRFTDTGYVHLAINGKMDIQLLKLDDLNRSIEKLAEEMRQSNLMTQQLLKALGEKKVEVFV